MHKHSILSQYDFSGYNEMARNRGVVTIKDLGPNYFTRSLHGDR
jgi:hypothetical protein